MSVVLQETSRFSVISVSEGAICDQKRQGNGDVVYDRFLSLTKAIPYENARMSSRAERASSSQPDAPNLTYGEVSFESLAEIFKKIKEYDSLSDREVTFVDLGSGCGRPIIAAALLHPFKHLIGIEILEGLHYMALEAKNAWLDEGGGGGSIEFIHGDILQSDWYRRGDVILANSTCFSIPFFAEISPAPATEVRLSIKVSFAAAAFDKGVGDQRIWFGSLTKLSFMLEQKPGCAIGIKAPCTTLGLIRYNHERRLLARGTVKAVPDSCSA
jgi:hypothetical protein